MDRHEIALKKLASGTVIPATPLCLGKDGDLDVYGMKLLMNYYLDCGVGGIATAVHTTQFEIRDEKFGLFEPVIKLVSEEIDAYEEANNKVVVKVCGVCGDTEQAVKEAFLAKEYGYDAVLLSPGGLNDKTEQYMLTRTWHVAQVMPVIGFYLQNAVGGRSFSYDYWLKTCNTENVVAIKCASFNRYQTLDVVRAAAMSDRSDEITLYTGNDDNIVIDLLTKYRFKNDGVIIEKGFDGGLLGHWSVWTSKAVKMFETLKKHKDDRLIPSDFLTLAEQVTDANGAFFDTANSFKGCIAGIHAMLHKNGLMDNTACLNPSECLSQGQKEELLRVSDMYPHLNDDEFIAENIEKWREKAGYKK